MRSRTESSGVQIPPQILGIHIKFCNSCLKFLHTLLSLRTSYYLANLREEHVHSSNGLAIAVLLHIEGLDIFWIIGKDNRFLKVFLHKVALVLALQVNTPGNRELKFLTAL